MKKSHYVYILRCSNQSLYTGWTTDLKKRLDMHNQGKGAKYTKAFGPCQLVYFECYDCKSEALKREAAIKKMDKPHKEKLVQAFQQLDRSNLLEQSTEF